ncbi:hypothetical protein ABDK00_014560 [Niabella insulamsoli]|uniref:hypothetical protein n=1 Tax=Niabella insulamsoli TaxID=3144874 RepID=UPI0031FBED3F
MSRISKLLMTTACSFSMFFVTNTYAQVKVGSNPTTISSNTNLEVEATNGSKTVVKKDNGNVGIGTSAAPTNKLHVASTGTDNPVRFENMQTSTTISDRNVVADASGVLKYSNASLTGAISVRLSQTENMSRGGSGGWSHFTNDAVMTNTIPGASYNSGTDVLTIPAGTYLVTYTIDGGITSPLNGSTSVYVSSFFNDFANQSGNTRIHMNVAHNNTTQSNFGLGTTFLVTYTSTRSVNFGVGWGVGGTVPANTSMYFGKGTGISYIRIGN